MKKIKKILIIVVIVLITLGACFFGLSLICSNSLKNEQANSEEILNNTGSKKALILYQDSTFGLTKNIVNETASILADDGYCVTMNHPRSDLSYDLSKMDIVVLISPVYAKSIAEPLKAYAKSHDFSDNKVYIVITGQMLDETKEINELLDCVEASKAKYGIKINGITEDYHLFLLNN